MAHTKNNKKAAVSFLELIVAGEIDEAYTTYAAANMRHHNPYFSGDAPSLKRAMHEDRRAHPNKVYTVQRVLADADIVAVHARLDFEDEQISTMATVHILRFEDARIVEMWDVSQQVPKDSPNENGMF